MWVLPHGLDALLEEAVVGSNLEFGGNLDVVVQRPEVLNSVEVDHRLLVGLPALAFVILVEPQCPSVLGARKEIVKVNQAFYFLLTQSNLHSRFLLNSSKFNI